MNMTQFNGSLGGNDFYRSNLWNIAFSGGPGSSVVNSFDSMWSTATKTFGGSLVGNLLDLGYSYGKGLVSGKVNSWANSNDGRRVMGLLNSKTVMSLMGELNIGTEMMNLFSSMDIIQYAVEAVQLPDQSLGHSYTRTATGMQHKFGKYSPGYLTVTFRQPPGGKLLQGWMDYKNLIMNPQTNARMYPDDIQCGITLTQFHRSGVPESVHQFSGCVPVDISLPELSYESNNELVKFQVRFAILDYAVGVIGDQAKKDFIDSAGGIITGWAGKQIGSVLNPVTDAIGSSVQSSMQRAMQSSMNGLSSSISNLYKFK